MKLVFVCSENIHRSRACEEVFNSKPGFQAKSAGTWDHSPRARTHLDEKEHLRWADLVLVMQDQHREAIRQKFPEWWSTESKKLEVLEIEDIYFSPDDLSAKFKPLCERKVLDVLRRRGLL